MTKIKTEDNFTGKTTLHSVSTQHIGEIFFSFASNLCFEPVGLWRTPFLRLLRMLKNIPRLPRILALIQSQFFIAYKGRIPTNREWSQQPNSALFLNLREGNPFLAYFCYATQICRIEFFHWYGHLFWLVQKHPFPTPSLHSPMSTIRNEDSEVK